jgi:hypothetical protein
MSTDAAPAPPVAGGIAASTTAAMVSGFVAILGKFFGNIGLVVAAVAAVIITLWAIAAVAGLFGGSRSRWGGGSDWKQNMRNTLASSEGGLSADDQDAYAKDFYRERNRKRRGGKGDL